ncbi:MAG TPA: hypothetical protein VKA45_09595, partial [Gaiellaceae bacterium]|nr:hypothetical protein [Gaiellaceae bacterium]
MGIVVDDLAAATAFFVEVGWVDRVVGLEGVRSEIAMLETPDGHGRLELSKFQVTVDGVMHRNGRASDEDRRGGFERRRW